MQLTGNQLARLNRIINLAERPIKENDKGPGKRTHLSMTTKTRKRIRRTGQEWVNFRKMLKNERRKGIPVAELARKHHDRLGGRRCADHGANRNPKAAQVSSPLSLLVRDTRMLR
jgi:hypothetical protein